MSPKFDNLKDLENFLLLKIKKAMVTTVASEVKQLESQNIQGIVYGSYNPKIYQRRMENGGLSDVNNMQHAVTSGGNMVVLTVDNITTSNQSYNPNDKDPFQLAGLVEYGDGNGYGEYDYKSSSDYLNPRPFIRKTKEDLENGMAKEIIIKGLLDEGISSI